MRNRVFYYVSNYAYNLLPVFFFKRNYKKLLDFERTCNADELKFRLDYYLKITDKIHLPHTAVSVKNFKKTSGTGYYLDLKEFLHYFKKNTLFAYYFGDKTSVNDYPTLVKARTIEGENANSILFKLNKNRHFYFVKDSISFSEKKDILVWRGGAYQKNRIAFVQKFWNSLILMSDRPIFLAPICLGKKTECLYQSSSNTNLFFAQRATMWQLT